MYIIRVIISKYILDIQVYLAPCLWVNMHTSYLIFVISYIHMIEILYTMIY